LGAASCLSEIPKLKDLLSVNWFDGLVVGERHLLHADRRLEAMVAQVFRNCADQPGLCYQDLNQSSCSPLMKVSSASSSATGYAVQLEVCRSFIAVGSSGRVVVAYAPQPSLGIPGQDIHATVDLSDLSGETEVLVCVRQRRVKELSIQGNSTGDEALDLAYPGIEAVLVPAANYIQRYAADLEDYSPVAELDLSRETPVAKTVYIPPLLKLGDVSGFDSALLPGLESKYGRLFDVLSDQVEAVGAAFAKGNVGADLMSRRSNYEALRSLLIATKGTSLDLEQISVRKFLRELVQPVAFWWLHHMKRHFPELAGKAPDAPLTRVTPAAEMLLGTKHGELCAGSGAILFGADEFLADLATVIEEVG